MITELGTTYKRTGFHFDKRLEKLSDTIKYFKKNDALSFETDPSKKHHKLIIGDNYPALLNLLIEYKGSVDVIYIDPPYGKDTMGDFPKTNHYLGSLVVNGKEIEADVSRLGYCAMANDNIVIGIARNEDVKDYVLEQGGSFFRQFILVSDGVLPSRFHLHGKVERRGLGRIGDKLFYIETRHKETMWDFADALREYGFIDAIYITGGTDYCFYRTADGISHKIGDDTKYEDKHKGEGIVPWLVFKKR